MRAFVTGGTGFAGQWLCQHLSTNDDEITLFEGDITNDSEVRTALVAAEPEVVYHLAGQANVGLSWTEPAQTFRVNAEGTLNVVQAVASMQREVLPKVLIVGSAEVYGNISPADLPVRESQPLAPMSPYAASKAAAEQVALQAFRANGVPVVIVRPFNHIGPGQSDSFVVSALAHRIVAAKAAGAAFITVGNLSPRRDFTDVRDIVAAYRLAATKGEAGSIFNVSTGRSVSIATLAERMVELAGGGLDLLVDGAHQRAVDVPELLGDSSALREATGWHPVFSVDDTLSDVLAHAGFIPA
jgi:GDP-4-dehydro-6-deoxy-D-mannose reductase